MWSGSLLFGMVHSFLKNQRLECPKFRWRETWKRWRVSHPIIFMQCGPVRYRVDERKQASERPFEHKVIVRKTSIKMADEMPDNTDPSIHDLYAMLINNKTRNNMIIQDIIKVIKAKRSPILLTERKEHLALLADCLASMVRNVIVLKGGMGQKQRPVPELQPEA